MEGFNPLQVSYKRRQMTLTEIVRDSFQSLIGQLQTLYMLLLMLHCMHCFNPLQVSYKLLLVRSSLKSHPLFQSLIGQLQTTLFLPFLSPPSFVSIPYRLATNYKSLRWNTFNYPGFNPLQVSYKRLILFQPACINTQFQSLIGQLQTSFGE